MKEKIENLFENQLIASIAKGISIALAVLFLVVGVFAAVLCFVHSAWWLLAVFACMVASGSVGGFAGWLEDNF